MKTSLETIKKSKVLLKVEVPAKQVDTAIDVACKEISKKIRVPGFRAGKIPSKVVKSRVGMETIYNEVLQNVLPIYYAEAVEKEGIEPIARPELDVVQIEEGKALKFNAKVEVKPEVKLGKYKGIKALKDDVEIKDEWVDRQVQNLRERFAQLEPVERAVKKGDFALINFDGTVDGKSFEGGSAKDYLLEVGSKTFLEDFEKELEGANKGEIRDVFIDYPKDYGNPELAGKKGKFKILVKEVKQKILPDLNDDFAKEVSEFDTLGELKQDIRGKLQKTREEQVDFKFRMDLLNNVVEGSDLEIPESMIQNRKELKLKEFEDSLKKQGMNLDEYLKAANQDKDKLEKEAEKEATEELKKELVLDAIAVAEKVEISDEETDNEITKLAESMNKDPEETIKSARQQGTYEFFRENLRTRKTWDLLVEKAEVVDGSAEVNGKARKKAEKTEVENDEKGKEKKT